MPSPISVSACNSTMGERSCDKGWPSAVLGRERLVDHAVRAPATNGLDSQLWHACAGAMVHLPQVGAKVFYFPQGHAEHAASSPDFPAAVARRGTVLCRVLSVNFLADTETDEVYARIGLRPDPTANLTDDGPPSPPAPEKSSSFAKTLTQSDANNGGGFSVPRYCAETIFPKLNYSEDPPVQFVLAKDVHGTVWKFRHIYRGTPRRHLLTTGWSNFVNQKKLVAGDAIVFLKSSSGELCVGVRRSTRGGNALGASESSQWQLPGAPIIPQALRWDRKSCDSAYNFFGNGREGPMRVPRPNSDNVVGMANFARNRARVTASAVLEAATLAVSGEPFEVVYYPRATISEFCVRASAVTASLQQTWAPGLRFKMAVETEDASRISWFMGTISKVQEADSVHWPTSPWKMLQVTWDEPDLLQGVTRVSPWQVELVSPAQLSPFPFPKKKLRLLQSLEFQRDGPSIMGLPIAPFASNALGHIFPWHGFADNVSAGMQGARQDRSFGLTTSDIRPSKVQPWLMWENSDSHKECSTANSGQVSTDLSISNFAKRASSSTLSASLTVGSPSSEPTSNTYGSVRNKDGHMKHKATRFLLFGKTIDTRQSSRSPPVQLSSGSSLDSQRLEVPNRVQSEALCKEGSFVSCDVNQGNHEEVFKVLVDEVANFNQFKYPAGLAGSENLCNALDNKINHCKVFRDADDIGRTVDLSALKSYEELYDRLSFVFGVHRSEIPGRVVYLDLRGSSLPIGKEPYREFAKRAKMLKLLSETSSESFTR